jgi:integrase
MSRVVWQRFESVLADPITRYLAAKRSMGCRFHTEDRALRLLDRHLTEQDVLRIGDITSTHLEAFMASRRRASGTSYNDLLGVVRRLLEWMVDQQELTTSPLTTQPQRQSARSLPYLYDPETIRRILDYAAELPDWPRCRHRGPTYATIFALLAGLGLRIGEVSRLQCGDVDLQGEVLLVRNSKFGKSRLVPFGPRLTARLRAYAVLREQRLGFPVPDAPFFTWNGRSTVVTNSIRNAFRDHIRPRLALEVPSGIRAPCVHGLRHYISCLTMSCHGGTGRVFSGDLRLQ